MPMVGAYPPAASKTRASSSRRLLFEGDFELHGFAEDFGAHAIEGELKRFLEKRVGRGFGIVLKRKQSLFAGLDRGSHQPFYQIGGGHRAGAARDGLFCGRRARRRRGLN